MFLGRLVSNDLEVTLFDDLLDLVVRNVFLGKRVHTFLADEVHHLFESEFQLGFSFFVGDLKVPFLQDDCDDLVLVSSLEVFQ